MPRKTAQTLISSSLIIVLLVAPGYVEAQSTTTATTSNNASSNTGSRSNTALNIGLGVGAGLLGLSLLSSLGSAAMPGRTSFGGRIAAVIPCTAGLWITIVPAGVFPVSYIWTPATITYTAGPPRNIGQQVLGTADIPFVCFYGSPTPVPLYGLRMQMVGTSPF